MKRDQQEFSTIKKKVEISALLQFFNFVLLMSTATSFFIIPGSKFYITSSAFIFIFLIGILNLIMLIYQKKNKDPFLILIILNTMLFYQFRVFNLMYYEYFKITPDYIFEPRALAASLHFIFFANLSMFLGLLFTKPLTRTINSYLEIKFIKPKVLIPILLIATTTILNCFFRDSFLTAFLSNTFFHYPAILLLFTTYYYLCSKYLDSNKRFFLFSSLILFALSLTILGGRSAILQILASFLMVALAIKEKIYFSYSFLFKFFFLFLPISILCFALATDLRDYGYDPSTAISLDRLFSVSNVHSFSITKLCAQLFDRLGYLTYCQKILDSSFLYSKFISFKYYSYSFIDNITPGFNFFEAPKASTILHLVDNPSSPTPSFKDVLGDYHSDMFTIYAEYKILFGYLPALFMFFISAVIFKMIYFYASLKINFDSLIFKILLLNSFYLWLNSFGLDWQIIDFIDFILTILLFKSIFNPFRK
jgi:hypothetical protein